MTFTSTSPTTPGFYAWRSRHDGCVSLLDVWAASNGEIYCCESQLSSAVNQGGEWCRLAPEEEIEKAYREGWMHRDKFNYRDCDTVFTGHSRAKRVMEGKE